MPPKKKMRLSTKKKGRSKESDSEINSFSDEDASQEVKTKFCEKENSVKKFLLGAVKKTQEIVGMGNKSISKKKLKCNGTSTSMASERSDGHNEMDRRLKKVVNDECLSSSSSKSGECGAINISFKSSSSEISIVKETKKNKPKMSLTEISAEWSSCEEVDTVDNGTKKNKPKLTLTEISAEWSSCEEVDAVDNGNSSELVSASMESIFPNKISEVTNELAGYQWSSVDEDGEQYFDIEIMSSTDEDHLDGKKKSEKETLVQRVRNSLLSTVQKIYSKELRRGKTELHEKTLHCEILENVNVAEYEKELKQDILNLEDGGFTSNR
jgi:hypothetical protein